MGSLRKKITKRHLARNALMALCLFWDIMTSLPCTPNGVGFLEHKGYCILLQGVYFWTLNSPDGADASLNKLLLLLLWLYASTFPLSTIER